MVKQSKFKTLMSMYFIMWRVRVHFFCTCMYVNFFKFSCFKTNLSFEAYYRKIVKIALIVKISQWYLVFQPSLIQNARWEEFHDIWLYFQTVSLLEQRLTMTENKLRECLDNQQRLTLQVRPSDWLQLIEDLAIHGPLLFI